MCRLQDRLCLKTRKSRLILGKRLNPRTFENDLHGPDGPRSDSNAIVLLGEDDGVVNAFSIVFCRACVILRRAVTYLKVL